MQREKERELQELERATRTVFVYNLNIAAEDYHIADFFSTVGGPAGLEGVA
jgi:RNA-binding protein 39